MSHALLAPTSTLVVEPYAGGRWVVRDADTDLPLSEHQTACAAERRANHLVRSDGVVLVRDLYARVRSSTPRARPAIWSPVKPKCR